MIRSKFTCQKIVKFRHWNRESDGQFLYEAEFTAVVDGSEENKRYFEATPSGTLKLATLKDDLFEPGKTYYLDITEAL